MLKSIVPHDDESIQSIAIRLAPLALATTDEFLRLGLDYRSLASLSTNSGAIHRLIELGRFDATEMRRRSVEPTSRGFRVYARELPQDWVSLNFRRLAPGVLVNDGEEQFHRLAWQLIPMYCDVSTGELLIDSCPRCHQMLRWARLNSVSQCGICQFDMRNCAPKYVPADKLDTVRGLQAFLLGAGSVLPEPFDEADDITLCRAMEWLAYFVDVLSAKCFQPSPRNAAAGINPLYSWPDSFDRAVAEIMEHWSSGGIRSFRFSKIIEAFETAGTTRLYDILLTHVTETLSSTALAERLTSKPNVGPKRRRFVRKVV